MTPETSLHTFPASCCVLTILDGVYSIFAETRSIFVALPSTRKDSSKGIANDSFKIYRLVLELLFSFLVLLGCLIRVIDGTLLEPVYIKHHTACYIAACHVSSDWSKVCIQSPTSVNCNVMNRKLAGTVLSSHGKA